MPKLPPKDRALLLRAKTYLLNEMDAHPESAALPSLLGTVTHRLERGAALTPELHSQLATWLVEMQYGPVAGRA